MSRVVASATMSLDGFIANPDDTVEPLFDWFDGGDVEIPSANPRVTFHLSAPSAAYWRSWTGRIGCVVVGRPPGAERFRFVTTGIADALDLAADLAGDAVVAVAAGEIAGQALELGRLDEVAIDLVPVVLGEGKRYFGSARFPVARLGDPTTSIAAPGVTHLVLPVLREE